MDSVSLTHLGTSSSITPRGKAWDDQDCRLMQDFSDTSHAYSPPHSQHLRQGRRESPRGQSLLKTPLTHTHLLTLNT